LDAELLGNLRHIWKNNLACLVILKAKEIGVTVKEEGDLWRVYGTGKTVHSILEKETFRIACRRLMEYRIFFTQQLVDQDGKKMITWKKFRALRTSTQKGRKAKWFSEIKQKMLSNQDNRTV
jgi:hypothetical protein